MNANQKLKLKSNVLVIREQAYELAVYEILYGNEPIETLNMLLDTDIELVYEKVPDILKTYVSSKNHLMLDRYREIFLSLPVSCRNFQLLINVYLTLRKGLLRDSLVSDIINYPLEELKKFGILYNNMNKDDKLVSETMAMIPKLGAKINGILNLLPRLSIEMIEKISNYISPGNIGKLLTHMALPNFKKYQQAQPIVERLILGENASYLGYHFSSVKTILCEEAGYEQKWQFQTILKLIEIGALSGEHLKQMYEGISSMLVAAETESDSRKSRWDNLEHSLIRFVKVKPKQVANVLVLIDLCARKMVESEKPDFMWVEKPVGSYDAEVVAALKFELSMIKLYLENECYKDSNLLKQLSVFLIKYKTGKIWNEKRKKLQEQIQEIAKNEEYAALFAVEDLDIYTSILAENTQNENSKIEVGKFLNVLVENNKHWFLDGSRVRIEHIETLHTYCTMYGVVIKKFDLFYRYEYYGMQEDLKNQEDILESLRLPKPSK